MRAIETCRTPVLGGHLDVCDQCGFERPAYNSCRNRHCPKCQSLAQAKWVEARIERLLPTNYFHLVFTLPGKLRPLALHNRRCVFGLLFQAASRTLLDLGKDKDWLGAVLGFSAVLHTWNRVQGFHPHLHCIVTGGGLSTSGNGWVGVQGGRYLFPVKVLSTLFRGKFLAGLAQARRAGKLRFAGTCAAVADDDVFAAFKDELYRKDWVVYAKRPFGGAEQVYRYLGRYTHRVSISSQRLEAIDDSGIRFRTKNGDTATLAPQEFIRRFLLHVLPRGFVKIRHYGLLASANVHTKLEKARCLLGAPPAATEALEGLDWRGRMLQLTQVDLRLCPACEEGTMLRRPLRRPPSRAPPLRIAS